MATQIGYLYHPVHGDPVPVFEGMRWPAFFFGSLWYGAKGLWPAAFGWAFVLIACASLGLIGWLLYLVACVGAGAFANESEYQKWRRAGYLMAREWQEKHGQLVPNPD